MGAWCRRSRRHRHSAAGSLPGRFATRGQRAHDTGSDCVLSLLRGRRGGGRDGHLIAQPGAFGAVSDPGLLQRGRAVRADGRRVPGDDPGDRLRRIYYSEKLMRTNSRP